jgi:hypothetical protein
MHSKNRVGWTKAEKERIARALSYGCVICGHDNHDSRIEVHHLLLDGRQMGHGWTLPLCQHHHQRHGPKYHLKPVSLADGSKLFTQAYGTQRSLYEALQHRLGLPVEWPESKLVPRLQRIDLGSDWA